SPDKAQEQQQGVPLKARVLTAVAALALAAATAPPILFDYRLGSGGPPLLDVQAWVQHVNVLTS
ncbi:hypothetical protein, partial [Nonomuraea turkmeniaca]|uniref:hypothetical protein n=1 Tax=Nonomuraea turkmeniaca TaxID=103838 RepID=UPI001B85F9F7